ncbi:MAG: DUF4097 domain-containing protein [candidate division Zixibacteria bacterium]|nr:DUF4097 domain-containing protein [candidate division Zixibacteria bacterium]
MKKNVLLKILTCGALLLFFSTFLQAKEFSFPLQKEFTLEEPLSLEVEDPRGEIILESHDLNKIIIQTTKIVEAKDSKEAEELAQKIRIDIEKAGALVSIKTKYQRTNRGGFWERLFTGKKSVEGYVSYHIFVPKDIREADISVTSGEIRTFYLKGKLNLSATSGDIELAGVEGEILSSATSGSIQARDLKGKISLEGTSSDIQVKNLEGDLSIDCTSGTVNIEEFKGSLKSSQTSGDLEGKGLKGDISITTTSGDVSVEQTDGGLDLNSTSGDLEAKTQIVPSRNYSLKTTSGVVYLSISKGAQADLKLETTSGEISLNLPMVLKTASRYSLSGKLGSGGAKIEIETVSGDISIEEY